MTDATLMLLDTGALISRFIQLSESQIESDPTPEGQKLWSDMAAVAEELVRRGDQDKIVNLAADARVPVKFYAGLFCDDFAPEKLRRALVEVVQDRTYKWLRNQAKLHLAMRFRDYHEKVYAESQRMVIENDTSEWDFASWADALKATARKDPQHPFERYERILADSASSLENDGSPTPRLR